jgi:hypothetical protein
VVAGAIGSFFTAAVRFVVAAADCGLGTGALRVGAAFLAPDFVTIVVPALVELPSLSLFLPVGAVAIAVAGRLVVCLLGARADGFCDAGFAGLLDGFSGTDDGFPAKVVFIGDRGGTRGL